MRPIAKGFGDFGWRLLPPGKKKVPLFYSDKKYPYIGRPVFVRHMTLEDRDKLYSIFLDEGLDALFDAIEYMESNVWIHRYRMARADSAARGEKLMEEDNAS